MDVTDCSCSQVFVVLAATDAARGQVGAHLPVLSYCCLQFLCVTFEVCRPVQVASLSIPIENVEADRAQNRPPTRLACQKADA